MDKHAILLFNYFESTILKINHLKKETLIVNTREIILLRRSIPRDEYC